MVIIMRFLAGLGVMTLKEDRRLPDIEDIILKAMVCYLTKLLSLMVLSFYIREDIILANLLTS
jgi:hypothetical protein